MADETATGSAGTPDGRGHPGGSAGEQSPLQARAQFLKNRSWELVISLNRGACARGSAQHGQNSESYGAVEAEWRQKQSEPSPLAEVGTQSELIALPESLLREKGHEHEKIPIHHFAVFLKKGTKD